MKSKRIEIVFFAFFVLYITGMISHGYAQPKLIKGKIPSNVPSEVRRQIERLYSADPRSRENAAWKLGGMGKKAELAIPYLLGTLGNDREGDESARAIVRIKGREAFGLLIGALKDGDEDIMRSVTLGLTKLGNSITEPLIVLLKDSNPRVRRAAILALGEIRDSRAVDPLIVFLKDKDTQERMSIAEALAKIGDIRAVEPLVRVLEDDRDVESLITIIRHSYPFIQPGEMEYEYNRRLAELPLRDRLAYERRGRNDQVIRALAAFMRQDQRSKRRQQKPWESLSNH